MKKTRLWKFSVAFAMLLGAGITANAKRNVVAANFNELTKLTAASQVEEGNYLVVYSTTTAMKLDTSNSYMGASTVSLTATTKIADDLIWKFEGNNTDGYTISNGSNYLNYTSGNTVNIGSNPSTNSYKWTFGYASNLFQIQNKGTTGRYLQYNTGAPRFACYTGTQQHLSLYKLPADVPVDTPTIAIELDTDNSNTIEIGATTTFVPTLNNADGALVTWNSSNTGVATVADGVVTGVAVGTTKITASITVDGVTYTSNEMLVTVTAPALPEISIELDDNSSNKIAVGETAKVNANVVASKGATVEWVSSDEDVATVDSNGVVTALVLGTTTITASFVLEGQTYTSNTIDIEVVPYVTAVYNLKTNFATYAASGWGSYATKTISSTDVGTGLPAATITFSEVSKQSGTITDCPVTRTTGKTTITLGENVGRIVDATLNYIRWSNDSNTISVYNSNDVSLASNNLTATSVTATDISNDDNQFSSVYFKGNAASNGRYGVASIVLKIEPLLVKSDDELAQEKVDVARVDVETALNAIPAANVTAINNLPVSHANGSTVSYSSDNPAVSVNSTTGAVTVTTAATGNTAVNLTATVLNTTGIATKSATLNKAFTVKAHKDVADERLALDLQELATFIEVNEIDCATDITSLPTLPVVLTHGTVVTWSTDNAALVLVDNETGAVVVNVSNNANDCDVELTYTLLNTYNGEVATTSDYVLVSVLFVNPTAKFDVVFEDYDEYDQEDVLVNTVLTLPVLNDAFGKVFAGWKDEAGNIYNDSVIVINDLYLVAVWNDTIDAEINTMASIKLAYDSTSSDKVSVALWSFDSYNREADISQDGSAAISTKINADTNADYSMSLTQGYASRYANGSLKMGSGSAKGIASFSIPAGTDVDSISFDVLEYDSNSDRGKNVLVKVNGAVVSTTATSGSWQTVVAPITVSATAATSITIESGVASSNRFNLDNVEIYKAAGLVAVPHYATSGLRFGATFNTTSFDKAGVLVMPAKHLAAGTTVIDYYLANGDHDSNVNSQILNIDASSNAVVGEGTVFFSGVVAGFPDAAYTADFAAVCYYELDGQIYFSKPVVTSFMKTVDDMLQLPNLTAAQRAVLLVVKADKGGN